MSMSSSGPFPEKVSLHLQQETAGPYEVRKLVQVGPPTGVQHKRWGWELNLNHSGEVTRTTPLFLSSSEIVGL